MSNIPFSWIRPDVIAKNTKYGMGLFATKEIQRGELIIAFGGYIFNGDFLKNLPKHLQEHPFQVDDDLFFGQVKDEELSIVDYLNHNCEPNCGFKGQAFIVAMRKINIGEEVTIDYAMCTSSNLLRDFDCLCGANICRGAITFNDWKIPQLQDKYRGHFQFYLEEKIKNIK